MRFLLVFLVLLACGCRNTTVKAIAILEKTDGDTLPVLRQAPAVPSDGNKDVLIAEPKVMAQPAILVAQRPAPLVLPPENTQEVPVAQPAILIAQPPAPPVLPAGKPQESPVAEPAILIALPPVEQTAAPVSNKPAANIALCARTPCPRIYCPNSLPPIPSKGICCQRCISNPACKASACPKLNCSSNLTPANLSAGECCDRCAPLISQTPTTTTTTTTTTTEIPTTEPKNDSSSSEVCESGEDSGACKKKYARLVKLLIKAIAQLRRLNKNEARKESGETDDE